MAIQTLATIKNYFSTGKKPTQQQFADTIDTLGQSNVKTITYIVGAPGVTGCNHNFTAVANAAEQSIQLGGTTIIAGKCVMTQFVVHTIEGLNGALTGTGKLGLTSGSNTLMTLSDSDSTDDIQTTSFGTSASVSSTSVYMSFTPSANWDTMTNGKWKVYITYIDLTNL